MIVLGTAVSSIFTDAATQIGAPVATLTIGSYHIPNR